MAFFDKLGSKISDTANSVGGKTKGTMRISKLRGDLRNLHSERQKLMTTLGETYFEARGSAEKMEPLSLVCERIEALDRQMQSLQIEIDRLSGVVRCPVCNTSASSSSRFCPHCGAKMPEAAPEPAKPEKEPESCAKCGAPREDSGRFCAKCGAPFEASPAQAESPEVNPPEAESPIAEPAPERPAVEINWPKPDDDSDDPII